MGCCYSAARTRGGKPPPKPSKWEPLEKRSCTDVIPLTVFILYFIGMILIAAFAIVNGAASRLVYGYDSYGNTCGKLNNKLVDTPKSGLNLTGKEYVFYMNVLDPDSSLHICVKKCPPVLMTMQQVYDFYKLEESALCDYDIPPESYLTVDPSGVCPRLPYKETTPVLSRCVPTSLPQFLTDLTIYVSNLQTINLILGDIYVSRYTIMGLCFLAVLVSIIIVLMLRFMASIVVYLILVLVSLSCVGGTVLLWWVYASPQGITFLDIQLHHGEDKQAFLWYAIAASVFTVIMLLIILVMRTRVGITVELFYEAGKCITHVPCMLVQPLWTFIILLLFWVCWMSVFAFLSTSGTPYLYDAHNGWVQFNQSSIVTYARWYHVVGLIWISEFILACQQMTIAGTVVKFYFTRDKSQMGNPILESIGRLIGNHLGSCALGSFIITLVKVPRCILMYIHSQFKDSENILAKCLIKGCICCLWVLEKCLKYLNYNAYTLVAVNGTHFCKSACDAIATLASNALRVIAINSVGAFVLFLGKVMVVAITAGTGGIFMMKYHPNLTYVLAPLSIVAIFSYLIAHCFISIYEMAIDTLLLCFCEDCRVNDGSPGSEYFMSKSLMVYVKKSTRRLDRVDGKPEKNNTAEGVPLNDMIS